MLCFNIVVLNVVLKHKQNSHSSKCKLTFPTHPFPNLLPLLGLPGVMTSVGLNVGSPHLYNPGHHAQDMKNFLRCLPGNQPFLIRFHEGSMRLIDEGETEVEVGGTAKDNCWDECRSV